jgi:hypothetical protein
LPGRWDTAHNTAHAHTLTHTHHKTFIFDLLFIHDDLANMVSISLIFSLMLAGLQLCEYHRERRTHIFTHVSLSRERERETIPKGDDDVK